MSLNFSIENSSKNHSFQKFCYDLHGASRVLVNPILLLRFGFVLPLQRSSLASWKSPSNFLPFTPLHLISPPSSFFTPPKTYTSEHSFHHNVQISRHSCLSGTLHCRYHHSYFPSHCRSANSGKTVCSSIHSCQGRPRSTILLRSRLSIEAGSRV